jgi:hypothetical protein
MKKLMNLKGVKTLNKKEQQEVSGGNWGGNNGGLCACYTINNVTTCAGVFVNGICVFAGPN